MPAACARVSPLDMKNVMACIALPATPGRFSMPETDEEEGGELGAVFGRGPVCAGSKVSARPGMLSLAPAKMRSGLAMRLARASASTVVWNRRASAQSVSPR